MCYWRQVRNFYTQCGHAVNLIDEEIKCDLVRCKFSPAHPRNCSGQACVRTCWQYRQSPQRYTPHLNKRCEACRKQV
ncbi:hypothetical protein C8R44DRAFT_78487 [Mycena epipterygia]|nr:hypothetical protein C8R44DRAFT_78487 [Mycena epipterygia]